jgi:UDP-N-acetylglucosamine acyltransferase
MIDARAQRTAVLFLHGKTIVIDPSAIVSAEASIAPEVTIGPYVVIGPHVTVGAGCHIGPFTRIEGPSSIGERNYFYGHASIGGPPQGRKFRDQGTDLSIGDDNVFREFVTVNCGTSDGGGSTTIGSHNLFMAYSHVAHDCHVGSNTVFANNATLAGHVEVGDFVTVGAFSAVHQFCRVGDHAFIGGGSMITQDALPYAKTVGVRDNRTYGINSMGLERRGFSKDTIEALQRAYRILVRSRGQLEDALKQIESDLSNHPEARYLVAFVRGSQRGVIRRTRV